MKQQEPDVLLNGWVKAPTYSPRNFISAIKELFTKTLVIAELEVRKLRHDPSDLVIRAVQPALWLLIFGQVFTRTRAIPTGNLPYLDFMTPGILAQSVLFVAIFTGGMTLIWERDLGIVQKFLASPIPRAAIVLGKALSVWGALFFTSGVYLRFSVFVRCKTQSSSFGFLASGANRNFGSRLFLYFFTNHRLFGEIARKVYGNWAIDNNAVVFCQ